MATEIIDARVWTKADTYTNWMANPLALGKGEIALVVDGIGDPVSMRWGNGVDRFSDLVDYMPEQEFYIKQAVDASLGSIANGQVIAWDSVTNKFIPYTLPSPAGKQDLQDVTNQGNTTTRDIVTRGTRNINFLEVPNEEPAVGDMLPNRWYMYLNVNAPSGSDPEPDTDFYIKQAKDADLDSISDGQLVSWSVAQNKFVPASFPSLSGYATQSWVLSHDYASRSWVQGQGYLTEATANGLYKPLSYVPSWGEITGKPLIDVNPTPNSIVQRDWSGYVEAVYFRETNSTVLSSPAAVLYGGNGSDGYFRKYNKQAVNQFLGSPENGDTFQSVMSRGRETNIPIYQQNIGLDGYPTLSDYKIPSYRTYSDNYLYGFSMGLERQSGNYWMQVQRFDSAQAYSLILQPAGGAVGVGTTTPKAGSLLDVNGKITCPVIESQHIIPTSPPSSMESGKWYLTIRTT